MRVEAGIPIHWNKFKTIWPSANKKYKFFIKKNKLLIIYN